MMTTNTELENVKTENRDLQHDKLNLSRRLDLAHEKNHKLVAEIDSLERQLRDSEHLLRIALKKHLL